MKVKKIALMLAALLMAVGVYARNFTYSGTLSISEALEVIEQQTGYLFVYNPEEIPLGETVKLSLKDASINETLTAVFNGKGVKWEINDKNIILNKVSSTQVKGKFSMAGVITEVDGTPVIGAAIQTVGKSGGVVTDPDGHFVYDGLSDGDVLHVTCLGFVDKDLKAYRTDNAKIVMEAESQMMNELVVIGYGSLARKDVTSSIVSLSGGDLVKSTGAGDLAKSLQGKIPGLVIGQEKGVNSSATMQLRGMASIVAGNSPLVVIDGFPGGDIRSVNPDDIKSIDVLKDASAGAIYGTRAAAGVILITTKRAKSGEPTSVDYTYSISLDYPTRMPEYEDAVGYMKAQNEQMYNDTPSGGLYSVYTQEEIADYRKFHAQNPDLYPDTDWLGMILKKNALRQSHALSITSAGKTTRTKISLGYDDVDGLFRKNLSWKRFTVRANNDIRLAKWLNVSLDLNMRKTKSVNPYYSPSSTMRYMPPTFAAEWSDGRTASGKEGINPYGKMMEGGTKRNETWLGGGKFQVEITPVKGLKITGAFVPKYVFEKDKDFNIAVPYTPWNDPTVTPSYLSGATTTDLKESRTDTYTHTTQLFANYDIDLGRNGDHHLSVMAGVEDYYKHYEDIYASRDQFKISYYPYLSMGSTELMGAGVNNSPYENAYVSVFGRVNYNYKSKYYAQANFRYDGSGRFKKGNRWGFFPSVSAGWVLTQEKFMEGARNVLSFLKLRASYGQLGNDRIGNYPYQSTLSSNDPVGFVGSSSLVQALQGFSAYQMVLDDITWETTETYDVGIDVNFLNDRLRITADYYKKTTRDMLILVDIPSYLGYTAPYKNSGDMNTKGWDLSVAWSDHIGDDFSYSVAVNLSDYKSMMGYIGNDYQLSGGTIIQSNTEYKAWYGYRSNGLFQTAEEVAGNPTVSSSNQPGDVRYVDLSGKDGVPDGTISATYDRTVIGSSMPRYNFGGSINLAYKGFDLGCTFQGVAKRDALLTDEMVQPLRTGWYNVPKFVVNDHWSVFNTIEQNRRVRYPRYSQNSGTTTANYAVSDYWLIDGSYFRIKDITLGYTLPQRWLRKIFVKDLRLSATLSDFFTFSHFPKGWDPEVSSTGYPITKSVIFTASIKF